MAEQLSFGWRVHRTFEKARLVRNPRGCATGDNLFCTRASRGEAIIFMLALALGCYGHNSVHPNLVDMVKTRCSLCYGENRSKSFGWRVQRILERAQVLRRAGSCATGDNLFCMRSSRGGAITFTPALALGC